MTKRPLRVMWLLNHTTARKFEVPMLKRIGVQRDLLTEEDPLRSDISHGLGGLVGG